MTVLTALVLGLAHLGINIDLDPTSKRIGEWNKLRPEIIDDMSAKPCPGAQAHQPTVPTSRLLSESGPDTAALFLHGPSAYAPNEDGDIFYLPLGQRVYTDEYPILPSHPQYARIVEITTSDPARRIECFAYPYVDEETSAFRTQGGVGSQVPVSTQGMPLRFDFDDELVSFVTQSSRWFLDGQQIESYECR